MEVRTNLNQIYSMRERQNQKGFTLIEILVAIALIAILSAITIVAINPAKHFAESRDAQRSSDAAQILSAVTQYTGEQGHALSDFGTITNCSSGSDAIGSGGGNIDLDSLLVDEYIVAIPTDPGGGTESDTGYTICQTTSGRVEISAPSAETKTISVKR